MENFAWLRSGGDTTPEDWSKGYTVSGFGDGGKGPQAKGYGQSLEARKDKDMNLLLEPLEGNAALLTP